MKTLIKKSIGARNNHKEKLLDELVERAKPYVRASLAEWLDQILEQPASMASSEHPFFLTFKEFVKLSEDEQSAWRHRILDLEKDWLDAELAKRNAEWILVIGGKIVRWSSSLEKLPKKNEVYRLAKSRGVAPFIFVKDILIEELGGEYSKSSAWSKISLSDFYPTITLYIGNSNWTDEQIVLKGKHVVADFDTGCPVLIFDEAEMDETILSDMELQLSSLHLNQPYDYRVSKVKVAVLTKDGKLKAMPFLIRLVRKWRKSPFVQSIRREKRWSVASWLCDCF